jgi:hypothetical protein
MAQAQKIICELHTAVVKLLTATPIKLTSKKKSLILIFATQFYFMILQFISQTGRRAFKNFT